MACWFSSARVTRPLGVVQFGGGGEDGGRARGDDGDADDGDADDQPVAYAYGAPGRPRRPAGGVAPDPLARCCCLCAEAASSAPVLAFLTRPPMEPEVTLRSHDDAHPVPLVRLPTIPVPVGRGARITRPPPEGVNITPELANKSPRAAPSARRAGRLDFGAGLWQYAPPALRRSRSIPLPDQAPDLPRTGPNRASLVRDPVKGVVQTGRMRIELVTGARRSRPPQRGLRGDRPCPPPARAVPRPAGRGDAAARATTGCVHSVPWFTARLGGALTELSVSRRDMPLPEVLAEAIAAHRRGPPRHL